MLRRGRLSCALVGVVVAAVGLAAHDSAGAPRDGGPLVLSGPVGLGNAALFGGGGGSVGLEVRFVEHSRFFVQMVLTNTSTETVTVLTAQTLQPRRSLVRQVETRLWPYEHCADQRAPCFSGPEGRYAARLTPVTLAAGAEAGVQLNYQLGSCRAAKTGSFATANALEIVYEDDRGRLRQTTHSIGRAKLLLQRPTGVECVPRPYSHIGLEGSFTTTPGHRPVLGSDGDTCVRSSRGALTYRSRLFTDRDGIRWRVKIWFPRFAGKGIYGPGGKEPVDVIATGSYGDPGKGTFHGHPSTATVTQAAEPLFGGRFEATFSGRRKFFRAYGAWRCTTKLTA